MGELRQIKMCPKVEGTKVIEKVSTYRLRSSDAGLESKEFKVEGFSTKRLIFLVILNMKSKRSLI